MEAPSLPSPPPFSFQYLLPLFSAHIYTASVTPPRKGTSKEEKRKKGKEDLLVVVGEVGDGRTDGPDLFHEY